MLWGSRACPALCAPFGARDQPCRLTSHRYQPFHPCPLRASAHVEGLSGALRVMHRGLFEAPAYLAILGLVRSLLHVETVTDPCSGVNSFVVFTEERLHRH